MCIDFHLNVVVVLFAHQVRYSADQNSTILASTYEQIMLLTEEIGGCLEGMRLKEVVSWDSRGFPLNVCKFIAWEYGVFL